MYYQNKLSEWMRQKRYAATPLMSYISQVRCFYRWLGIRPRKTKV